MQIWSKILEICQRFLRILDQICIKKFLKREILAVKGVIKHALRVEGTSSCVSTQSLYCFLIKGTGWLLSCFLLLCLLLNSDGSCETGKAKRVKKTPIVKSTPTSVPASNVKLFSAIFFEETCRYFDHDGWGEYMVPVVSGAVRGNVGALRPAEKCSSCRALADRFARGCKRAVGVSAKIRPKALEPQTEFIRYLTEVIHNSTKPPLPEEIKTFLSILAIAYQKAPTTQGKEYFSIIDSFIGPPLIAMLAQGQVVTPTGEAGSS
jgi:hypothetical protein